MKFKIDENLPVEVADLLRDGGHDAATDGVGDVLRLAKTARSGKLKKWTRAKKEALMRGDFEILHELSRSTYSKKKSNTVETR